MMALKNFASMLPLGLVLACGLPAFSAIDITALLRNAGGGSYEVALESDTEELATAMHDGNRGITNAFDGVTSSADDKYRFLMRRLTSAGSGPVPTAVLYTIPASVMPDYDFRVTALTIYPVSSGWAAVNRSVTGFRLEGRNGMENWTTIYETPEPQSWEANTFSRTFSIPAANRRCYRKYRFVATASDDASWAGFEELQLWGDLERRLTWNGADGASWNATDYNWVDASGVATNWIPGAKAVFGDQGSTCIPVEGTNKVCGIVFSSSNNFTVAGGTLEMPSPAEILPGAGGDVLASEIIDSAPVDAYDGTSLFPADPANTKQGTPILLWYNRRLSTITNFTGGVILQGGQRRQAAPYNYVNSGDLASVQFQFAYKSGETYATLCVKIILEQVGADVYGQVAYTAFKWANEPLLGQNFDNNSSSRNNVYDNNVCTDNAHGYGFYGIEQEGGEPFGKQPVTVVSTQKTAEYSIGYGDGYLPANASNPQTGDAVLYFPGFTVREMKAVCAGELYNVTSQRAASYHFFTNDGTTASVQIQGNSDGSSGARICVKVEFTDGEGGVYARAVYADYNWDWKNSDAPRDFDELPSHQSNAKIYSNGQAAPAYGVKKLCAVFARGERLTLGAPSITLNREFIGDSAICFAPLSGSQTIVVPEPRTFGKVAFGGTTAFAFADGASISADSAEVEEGAAVSLMGVLGGMFMRIGTEKCLTAAELAHFTVNGRDAVQKAEGWIMPKKGVSILLR